MSITFPRGFLANGVSAGIKKEGLDVGFLMSEVAATASGLFTTNQVKAVPVLITMEHIKRGVLKGIIANSGCANACTGKQGFIDVEKLLNALSSSLNESVESFGVASTGVIGKRLEVERIIDKIPLLVGGLSKEGGILFERSILTTDRVVKEMYTSFMVRNTVVRIGACAKGSGMIHPNMATLLSFITTDIDIDNTLLHLALKEAIDVSLNAVTVDKDTSTNDTVIIMANGMARNKKIGSSQEKEFLLFKEALKEVMIEIARKIAQDGEGATKLIEVEVDGAIDESTARRMARAVVGSNLFKAAIWGKEINWGRIISALGANSDPFDPEEVKIYIGSIKVVEDGVGIDFDKDKVLEILDSKEVSVRIIVGDGSASGKAWGCDLTPDYVYINGSYLS
ncbi:MAG: bifunctional glutamate N-acetyltransferase/amino-acid acetyltransferase ArgJ [bacterium]